MQFYTNARETTKYLNSISTLIILEGEEASWLQFLFNAKYNNKIQYYMNLVLIQFVVMQLKYRTIQKGFLPGGRESYIMIVYVRSLGSVYNIRNGIMFYDL